MQTPVCTGSASAAADEFTSESELAAPARVSSPVQFDHAHSSATARNFEAKIPGAENATRRPTRRNAFLTES